MFLFQIKGAATATATGSIWIVDHGKGATNQFLDEIDGAPYKRK
jgi:hypothetical protein